jgi:hypothetical protein
MTSEDLDEILNASIDLETGFKRYLLRLQRRLLHRASQQVLDMLMDRIFRKTGRGMAAEDLKGEFYEDLQYNVPSDIGPRELIEQVLEYENEHYHFYCSLNDMAAYTDSQDTCDVLLRYKIQQIKITRDVLDEVELTV